MICRPSGVGAAVILQPHSGQSEQLLVWTRVNHEIPEHSKTAGDLMVLISEILVTVSR